MENQFFKLTLFTFFLFLFHRSFGFVENVTHGYVNCMACHVSPSGGGLLNDYGRSLSRELMSTWSWENLEKPAFGTFQNKEWLKIGGDYRAIQTYLENSQFKQGKQFEMQKNIEFAFTFSKISIVGTLGTQEGPSGTPNKGNFLSERHYLLWDVNDDIKLRAGKFRLNFGIYDPQHNRLTKQPLGFGSNSESYILEFSSFSETNEIFISADLGRIDQPREKNREKSISVNFAKYVFEKSKIGTSLLIGESNQLRRNLFGLYGIGGFYEYFTLKGEADYQQSYDANEPTIRRDLISSSMSLGYQIAKGLFPYILAEYLQTDLANNTSQQSNAGLGIQWLPIPHIEIQVEYKKQNDKNQPVSQSDSGWVVFHFYL